MLNKTVRSTAALSVDPIAAAEGKKRNEIQAVVVIPVVVCPQRHFPEHPDRVYGMRAARHQRRASSRCFHTGRMHDGFRCNDPGIGEQNMRQNGFIGEHE